MSETERYWKARVARRYRWQTQFTDLEEMAEQAIRELEATIERLRTEIEGLQRTKDELYVEMKRQERW